MNEASSVISRADTIEAIDMHGKSIRIQPYGLRSPKLIQLRNREILMFMGVKYTSQLDEEPGCPLLLRSRDEGKTWEKPLLLKYDGSPFDIRIVPIYDDIGNVLTLLGWTRYWKPGCEQDHLISERDMIEGRTCQRYWITKSMDGGVSWLDYQEVNISGIPDQWTIKNFMTPGTGLILKHQADTSRNGRMIVPANHAEMNGQKNEFHAHLIVSDDAGQSWRIGAVQHILGSNESMAVELDDGTIIHNCRNQGGEPQNQRIQGVSFDSGESFRFSAYVESLFDPTCHAGFAKANVKGRELIFCSAPSGTQLTEKITFGALIKWGRRECLSIYASDDAGQSYVKTRQITAPGVFSAYSSLCATQNGKLLCTWETGDAMNEYSRIMCAQLSLEELAEELAAKR